MQVASNLEKSEVASFYRKMLLIRRFEESAGRLYMQGKIKGFLHLYIGQEAVAVGAIPTLGENDYVISHHRDHGHAITKGLEPKKAMAELMAKATGSSGGKAGSMHLFDPQNKFMGGHAIVAGHLPIAVGLALGIKYRKEDGVVMCFFGDGAVNEGAFHESLNLASIWKLPVIFFVENNLYGMGTHIDRTRSGGRDIYLTADAYKIPAAQIDGMDILAVREGTMEALRRVRSGAGPVFLEALTYRFKGHSVADPTLYRENEEVQEWEGEDPIERFKNLMLQEDLLDQSAIDEIDSEVADTIAEAVQFAEESPEPDISSLHKNVYV